jgi:hypothetical protein
LGELGSEKAANLDGLGLFIERVPSKLLSLIRSINVVAYFPKSTDTFMCTVAAEDNRFERHIHALEVLGAVSGEEEEVQLLIRVITTHMPAVQVVKFRFIRDDGDVNLHQSILAKVVKAVGNLLKMKYVKGISLEGQRRGNDISDLRAVHEKIIRNQP